MLAEKCEIFSVIFKAFVCAQRVKVLSFLLILNVAMEKVYVFLDTNNWIYLCNGFDTRSGDHGDLHFKLFEFLEQQVDQGRLVVLVNNIILEEFERNKNRSQEKIKDIEKKADGHKGNLKSLKKFVPDSNVLITELRAAMEAKRDEIIAKEKVHIARVENFLKNKTRIIEITIDHKGEAADMAVAKKAPFIGEKKNSMADAIHLLSAIDHIVKHETVTFSLGEREDIPMYPRSVFVSSNSGDFGNPADSKQIHPDLAPILERSQTIYKHNLTEMQDILQVEFLTEAEVEFIKDAEFSGCEVCEFDFANIQYHDPEEVYDPRIRHDSLDLNQLGLFQKGETTNPFVQLITAQCDHCGSDFLECPDCEELIIISGVNVVIRCESCDFKFMQHTETDRQGMVHVGELEIIATYNCAQCGDIVDSINEEGLCETCVEYNLIAEQSD